MASNYASEIQKGKSSEEYKLVKKHLRSIVSLIQHALPVLAIELFSQDFVSDIELGNAMNSNQPYNRALAVMMSILSKIENDSSYYSKFVSVLKDCDLGAVVAILESSSNDKPNSSTHAIAGECMLV